MNVTNTVYPIASFLKDSDCVGILIGYTDEDQLHCGIVYKSVEHPASAIHLAWHCHLCNETKFEKLNQFHWVKTTIHPFRARIISSKCRTVWTANKTKNDIPYGLHFNGSVFNEEGIIDWKPDAIGLTCATFVLSIFKSCGIELIDIKKWEPKLPDDEKWQKKIISNLEYCVSINKYNVTREHVDKVIKEAGARATRFRPEDVAASSTFPSYPTDQNLIQQNSVLIVSQINKFDPNNEATLCEDCK